LWLQQNEINRPVIPTYEEIMLPLLRMLNDRQEHSLQEADEFLSDFFSLTDKERRELLPSGQQPVFRNRLGWARTYLKKTQRNTRFHWCFGI